MPALDTVNTSRVSVDIGGTFTDIVIQDAATGVIRTGKVLSTRQDPAQAVLTALARFIPESAEISFLVHGTTVGLNAVLERRGARTGLLMTKGVEDAYLIGGNDRLDIFDLRYRKPPPLIEADQIFPVFERLDSTGSVQLGLDLEKLEHVVDQIRIQKLESLAVCLLFSFLSSEHEQAVLTFLTDRLEIPVVLSHRVSPEWREYARASTTVMTAYIAPVVERYLSTLITALEGPGRLHLHVMQSNGGVMTAATARREPIQTLLSGPVGGAIGAREVSRRIGRSNVICVDMGGTSFDVSLITDGQASLSNETELDGLPLQMAAVDISGIGAGGGSIAWLEAGALRVGPQSAGSEPGPVCYGQGGTQPTVTDANFVLGRVDAAQFAGGGMNLRLDAARESITALGASLEMTQDRTAQGILDIVNAAMADAIRTQTVKRGIDPRDFALVAFGGAGPMHAAALADELDIAEVVIPAHPGTFSAWGMLQTDVRHDLRRTFYRPLEGLDLVAIEATFSELEREGLQLLAVERIDADAMSVSRMVDVRYVGQEYSLTLDVPDDGLDPHVLKSEFDQRYKSRYGHFNTEAPAEIVQIRVAVTGLLARPNVPVDLSGPGAIAQHRRVSFDGSWLDCHIIARDDLSMAQVIEGPAIIEETTATTVVPPDWSARLVPGGHLTLTKNREDR